MIKFFRKIRQNLLMENKTGKYFKYAIGEIVLVVIGILIALQINNWNEQVKKDKKIATVFETVKKDLLSDINEANGFIDYYEEKDSLINLVVNRKVTKEHYQLNPNLRTVVMFYQELSINKLGYETLKENINDVPTKYENALIDINLIYTNILQKIEVNNKSTRQLLERTLQKWADNYNWYRTSQETYQTPNDDMINFFLKDSSYLGDVRMVKMLGIDNHLRTAKFYKIKAISALIKIDLANNITLEESLKAYQNSIGSFEFINLKPIEEFVYKKPTDLQPIPVFINNVMNEKLFIYYKNAEGVDLLIPFEKNSIEPNTFDSFNLIKDFPFIIKDSKGNALGTFKTTHLYNYFNLK